MSDHAWYGDKSEFYVYSTEGDDTIGSDRLDETFATPEEAVEHAREQYVKFHGFSSRNIQVFKVKLEYVRDVAIEGSL